jgi:large subunit ribosomal protein L29
VIAAKDVRSLTDVELDQKLHEAYQELFNLRFRQAAKQIANTGRIRVVRRDIARMQTVVRERQLRAPQEA